MRVMQMTLFNICHYVIDSDSLCFPALYKTMFSFFSKRSSLVVVKAMNQVQFLPLCTWDSVRKHSNNAIMTRQPINKAELTDRLMIRWKVACSARQRHRRDDAPSLPSLTTCPDSCRRDHWLGPVTDTRHIQTPLSVLGYDIWYNMV